MENLSVNEDGSTACSFLNEGAQMCAGQVLSNLLGVDDANADKKAEKFATKLGLKPENTLAQTAVYLVTRVA